MLIYSILGKVGYLIGHLTQKRGQKTTILKFELCRKRLFEFARLVPVPNQIFGWGGETLKIVDPIFGRKVPQKIQSGGLRDVFLARQKWVGFPD
jgi:hypothetical protein